MADTIVESRTDDPASPVAGQMWFRADLVPGYIPAAPSTGFGITAGDAQITLTVGTVAAATSYNAYYTSDGSTPTKSNGTKLTGVTDAQVVGSLINGTLYKFVFTAVNANGESAESGVASGMPAAETTFTQDFTSTVDFATDDHVGSSNSAGATIAQTTSAEGYCTITTTSAGSEKAFIFNKAPVVAEVATLSTKFKITNFNSNPALTAVAVLNSADNLPTAASVFASHMWFVFVENSGGNYGLQIKYVDSTAAVKTWNGSVWTTTDADLAYNKGSSVANTYYIFEIYTTDTQFWFKIKSADGLTTHADTSGSKVNWSSAKAIANNLFLIAGDQSGSTGGVYVLDKMEKS